MSDKKTTIEILNKIFGDSNTQYELGEFSDINIPEVLDIFEKEEGKFYIKCLKRDKDIVLKPEEVVRQLWIYKLTNYYNYPLDRIDLEKDIRFGHEIHPKAADIMIYNKDKATPLIIVEVKTPGKTDGVSQLKTYISSEGAPIGVWSDGKGKTVFYRPYPREFQTIREIPRVDQDVEDVLKEKLTLADLKTTFDLERIIKTIEELVLAGAGKDSFTEIFKLIYAKLYDEKEAKKRKDRGYEVFFRQSKDPKITFDVIGKLFNGAVREWPGVFDEHEKIELTPNHLSICVPGLEKVQLLDSDLRVIDAAFEYLITGVARGNRGQYFTPRQVVDMAVKMLNPKDNEYIIDPSCGSGGFLIKAMKYVGDRMSKHSDKSAKTDYAKKYLFGIDFDDKSTKVARAMMLIAGDGKSHVLKLNSLDSREWKGSDSETLRARAELQDKLHKFDDFGKNKDNQDNFRYFDFDILLANPPFAGEIKDPSLLREYNLAKNDKGKLRNKMERHILFIEKMLDMIRPGGRMAVVLPQGVLNGTNMEYVRDYIFDKARILAVVGLHTNTFKPHAGVKTSVLFLQKLEENEEPLKDYPIFMAVSKKGGKDNSGRYVYKKEAGHGVEGGKKILDHDLDEIADEFIKFAKEQRFSFM